jgi:hypothetical protein
MLDARVCAAHSVGKPEVSLAALKDLRQLLDVLDHPHAGNAQSTTFRPRRSNMNKQGGVTNRQLRLWETDLTIPPPMILTTKQQAELTAALAELLLSFTESELIREGGHDAE